jgi:dethiobiotin synthetase
VKTYFISGIGTNVGKTVVAAIITETLRADYWKPVQSGSADGIDSDTVEALLSNPVSRIFKENYLLKEPASPHLAAGKEGISIDLDSIILPGTKNHLVIEGAGGLMVPLNDKEYVIDLAAKFEAEIILVVNNYLGCINHTLLSIEYLLSNKHSFAGIIFNGDFDREVEKAIAAYKGTRVIGKIPHSKQINQEFIRAQAAQLKL